MTLIMDIYLDDLNEEKKEKVRALFAKTGDEPDFDVYPIATIELDAPDEE